MVGACYRNRPGIGEVYPAPSFPLLYGFGKALNAGCQTVLVSVPVVVSGGDSEAFDSIAIQVARVFALRYG